MNNIYTHTHKIKKNICIIILFSTFFIKKFLIYLLKKTIFILMNFIKFKTEFFYFLDTSTNIRFFKYI